MEDGGWIGGQSDRNSRERRVTEKELQVKVGVKVKGRVGVETEAALGLPDAGWLWMECRDEDEL